MNKLVKPALAVALALTMGAGSSQVFAEDYLNSKHFSDVNANNYGWAAVYVDSIAAKGIASGVGNNMFDPASMIKRGDFAIFLDKTFQFANSNDTLFNLIDVSPDKYYYQSVVNAKLAGGITDVYNYYPEDNITRIDAIRMIYNSLNVQNLIGGNAGTGVSMYGDSQDIKNISDTVAVGTLTNIGIITGSSDGNLYPNNNLTRAEMAVIFAKTSDYVDKTKADKKAAEAEKKQKEIDDAKAKQEDNTKEEKTVVSSGNADESIVIDNGKKFSAHDISLDIDNQSSEAVKVTGESDASIKNSSINSNNYTGVLLSGKSKLDLDNVAIESKDAYGIKAEDQSTLTAEELRVSSTGMNAVAIDNSKADIKNLTASVGDSGAALSVSAGSDVNITGANLTSSGKYSLISISSDGADNEKETKLTITDGKLNCKNGILFDLKDTTIDVLLDNCEVNVSNFLDVYYSRKSAQDSGSDITVSLKDTEATGDINVDNVTKLTLDIQEGGSFKGFIDQNMYSQDVNIVLAADGKLELLSDIYVNVITIEDFNFNNINDNGFNIYYNDANPDNNELYADTYSLAYGGELRPM